MMREPCRSFSILIVLIGLSGAQDVFSQPEYTRDGPRRIRTTTAPLDDFYFSLESAYETDDFEYSLSEFSDDFDDETMEDLDFTAENVYEWTQSFTISYGLTENLEIGFSIPLVTGKIEKDKNDTVSNLPSSQTETGLGDVGVFLGYSADWNDENTLLFTELNLSLPTDTRDDPFGGSQEVVGEFSLTGEQFIGDFEIIGGLGVAYEEDNPGDLRSYSFYNIGAGWQLTDPVFLAILMGEFDSTRNVEIFGEYAFNDTYVLEFFVGRDVDTENPSTSLGIAITF